VRRRTIRAAPLPSSRLPDAARELGPSAGSPIARSIVRGGARGERDRDDLAAPADHVGVRCRMVVGAIGLVVSLFLWNSWGGFGSRRTVVYDDGRAPVQRTVVREDEVA
jgi:hypothetical protein